MNLIKQRDWFIVGIRLMGVWTMLSAIFEGRTLLAILLGWYSIGRYGLQSTPTEIYVLTLSVYAIVGFFLFFFGDWIAGLVYREKLPPAAQDEVPPPEVPSDENETGEGSELI